MLSRIQSKNLSAFVVWVPQLNGTHANAIEASRLIDDPRARHYWDQTDITGTVFGEVLKIPGSAWDVYLAYAPGIKWTAQLPPKPTYWMQQLGMPNVPRLDASIFAQHVEMMLNSG